MPTHFAGRSDNSKVIEGLKALVLETRILPIMNDEHASHRPTEANIPPRVESPRASPLFDFGSMIEAIAIRWRWVLTGGLILFLVGVGVSSLIWRPTYTVAAQLNRYDPPLASDAFKPQAITTATLLGMISSPEVLQKTGNDRASSLSPENVDGSLKLSEDRTSGLITLTTTGKSRADAVRIANLFCLEIIKFTQTIQKKEALEAGALLIPLLANNEVDRVEVRRQLAVIEGLRLTDRRKEQAVRLTAALPTGIQSANIEISRINDKTQAARDQLADLQSRYTDAHPLVREQKARLMALESQLAGSLTAPGPPTGEVPTAGLAGFSPEMTLIAADQSTGYDALTIRLNSLEINHAELVARQRASQIFASNPPGYFQILNPASPGNVRAQHNRLIIGVLALLCGVLGAMGTIAVIAIRELLDDRLKTDADVIRVTRLPLLATLGNLNEMSPTNKEKWAFRTWTAFQNKLSVFPNRGLVCGFTSSGPGEGRSTWIDLLAGSARQCGFRVLTISSRPKEGVPAPDSETSTQPTGTAISTSWNASAFTALVMTTPAQIVERLTAPNLSPAVHLPLPGGWVWDLEHRKQWQQALNSWRTIENIVILVELPPISDPETVLLAENIPNVIWLAESHKAEASETIEQLEMLRNARCRLVGAVLNREPSARSKPRFSRWIGRRSSLLAWAFGLMSGPASAQVLPPSATETATPQTQTAFSVVNPEQRAPWQQRLTLGPGDLLDLSVFGEPKLTQEKVPVGPDGRISYLEAQNVVAAGLTVDDFRTALNTELSKFRSAPEVMVVPTAYRSKKYFVLGAVVQKGAFPLNRPMTIIEAVSEAHGLETGVSDRNLVVLADLSRSFVARNGEHLPVNLEKLFLEGDLSQNIALEPNDYLYFPAGERQQVFVLGEVRSPGPLTYGPQTTTLEAIAVRGGFSERAWRTRLLVIRGSLKNPQTFVVNAADVLSAKTSDFKLQPKDIVYVSSRPWIRAEELIDIAATAFIQSAVVTATGLHVDPIGGR